MNTHLREDVELLEGRRRLSRVSADGKAGFTMRNRAGANQGFLDIAQRSPVEPELDESRAYIRAVDAVNPLVYPAARQRLGRTVVHVLRQEPVFHGRVVAGGGEDVETALLRKPPQQPHVPAQADGRRVDESPAA